MKQKTSSQVMGGDIGEGLTLLYRGMAHGEVQFGAKLVPNLPAKKAKHGYRDQLDNNHQY